jgi:Clr5 domain
MPNHSQPRHPEPLKTSTEVEWDHYKELITHLYTIKKLDDVVKYMAQNYGFSAT